jgi:hypothetical protein
MILLLGSDHDSKQIRSKIMSRSRRLRAFAVALGMETRVRLRTDITA